jgi:hypothetical protein
MNKVRKLVLTVAALAALAVGGAAFASAQNSSSTAPTLTHQSSTEAEAPDDSDGGQVAEQNEQVDGEKADDQRSDGDGEQNDAAEAASEASQSGGQHEASDGDGESPTR